MGVGKAKKRSNSRKSRKGTGAMLLPIHTLKMLKCLFLECLGLSQTKIGLVDLKRFFISLTACWLLGSGGKNK